MGRTSEGQRLKNGCLLWNGGDEAEVFLDAPTHGFNSTRKKTQIWVFFTNTRNVSPTTIWVLQQARHWKRCPSSN